MREPVMVPAVFQAERGGETRQRKGGKVDGEFVFSTR